MKLITVLLTFIFTFKTFAGYECDFSLKHADIPDAIVASKIIEASDDEMKSGFSEELFLEYQMSALSMNVFISGWPGEEEVSASVLRDNKEISEKVSVRGDGQSDLWFDMYQLSVSCSLA
jgi:hypothetical protein